MSNLKMALVLGVIGSTAAVALTGFFLLDHSATRLVVDGGLALAQLAIVMLMLSPTERRVEMLIEALRALSRGERHRRVDASQFAGLAEVARAVNEVAASLTENEDAALGPVRSTARPHTGRPAYTPPTKAVAAPPRPASDIDDPSVGVVRKIKKEPKEPREPTPNAPSAPPMAADGAMVDVARPEQAAASNDTSVDEHVPNHGSGAPLSAESGSNRSGIAAEEPTLPSRAELDALFADFVATKKAHNESVEDLELEAFVQTIMGECARLVSAHQCRGVKFEITEQEGEVSLRPRLLR
jgi:hypothetical protein